MFVSRYGASTNDMFHPICFTICLFISPDLDGTFMTFSGVGHLEERKLAKTVRESLKTVRCLSEAGLIHR